ncbi:MAG TPA: Mur ligase domain-containing protein, partial [Phycisphaerae bacterium]|nr:Mur ligase domain-containing protein [Phycisphaerae bacterium]
MAERNPSLPTQPYAGRKIHFVGIGGCGMCGLAEVVLLEGGQVSGSDRKESAATDRLRRLGAHIHVGHDRAYVPAGAERVVASAAVPPDNPELIEARSRGIPVEKYARFLGRLMELRRGIAVAGTHGKSTTTAMTGFVLREAGLDPSFVIGADVPQLGGA